VTRSPVPSRDVLETLSCQLHTGEVRKRPHPSCKEVGHSLPLLGQASQPIFACSRSRCSLVGLLRSLVGAYSSRGFKASPCSRLGKAGWTLSVGFTRLYGATIQRMTLSLRTVACVLPEAQHLYSLKGALHVSRLWPKSGSIQRPSRRARAGR
jgi:hypothetical protein